MPYSNEHAARLLSPDITHIRVRRTHGSGDAMVQGVKIPTSIDVIWYIVESDGEEVPRAQALRFPTSKWTAAEAKKWLKDHDIKYTEFEPASEEADAERSGSRAKFKFAVTPAEFLGDVVKSVDEATGVIISHPTIEIEDRDGDIVHLGDGEETGLLLTEYRRNPVGLWQHGMDTRGMQPVYTTTSIESVKVKRHKAMEVTEKWNIEDPEDPFPRVLFRMHATNPPMLRARSIRFFPLEMEERDASQGWKGWHFKKSELREISAVAIGANPLALAVAVKADICDADFLVEHGILKGMTEADRTLGILADLLKDEIQDRVDAEVTKFKTDFEKRLRLLEPAPDALAELLRLTAGKGEK